MKSILVIDDEKSIRDMLRDGLTQYGYAYHEADNGAEGIEMFKKVNPDVVLTDVKMPEMSGIEVTRHLKEIEHDTDVIVMTGYGSEDLVIEALRSGASNYLKKPIYLNELFHILDNLILKRERRRKSEVVKDVVVFEQKNLIMNNDISKIWGIINQILFNIPSSFDENSIEGIRVGLYEIILNAIEHGNLGLSYEDKSEALHKGTYSDLITKLSNEADRKGKKVFINCIYNCKELSIEVRDQGIGFNFRGLANIQDQDNILKAHGRGIFLVSLYFDKIEYRDPGNIVILTKKLDH